MPAGVCTYNYQCFVIIGIFSFSLFRLRDWGKLRLLQ